MTLDPDTKALIDGNYEGIKAELRERQGLSLMTRALLAPEGAVSYMQKRLDLMTTGKISDLYSHYPWYHYVIGDKRTGTDKLRVLIRDGLLDLILDMENTEEYHDIQNSLNSYVNCIIDAAIDGYYAVLWYLYDNYIDEENRIMFINYFILGVAIRGDMEQIKSMEQQVLQSEEVDDVIRFNVYGAYGGLYGGNIEVMAYFCDRLQGEDPKNILRFLSVHSSSPSLYILYFTPTKAALDWFLSDPRAQILSPTEPGSPLIRDTSLRLVIARSDDYNLVKALHHAGHINNNDLVTMSQYHPKSAAFYIIMEKLF